MAYEMREGSGSLFPNDKGDNPKRPDYRGDFLLNGTVYEISGWSREGKKGTWLSVKIQPKTDNKPVMDSNGWGGKAVKVEGGPELDDEIPF